MWPRCKGGCGELEAHPRTVRGGSSAGTLADVTAEATAKHVMSQARDLAIEAIVMQKDFAGLASHEPRHVTSVGTLAY
jgi:hypothetical protein